MVKSSASVFCGISLRHDEERERWFLWRTSVAPPHLNINVVFFFLSAQTADDIIRGFPGDDQTTSVGNVEPY